MSAAAVTRRTLLGAGAALGVAGIPASVEAGIVASDLDAGLLDLIRRHGEAVLAMERATAKADRLVRAVSYPLEPDVLLWRPDDFVRTSLGRGLSDRDEGEEEVRRYGGRAAAWLRRRPAAEWYAGAWAPSVLAQWEERRREIVEAWDAREAARAEIDHRTGLDAAVRAEDDAAGLVVDLASAIKRSRPRSLPGLHALAAWFAREAEADDLHDDALAQLAAAVAAFGGAAT